MIRLHRIRTISRHLAVCLFVVGCLLLTTGCYSLQRQMLYFPSHEDVQKTGSETYQPMVTANGKFLGYIRAVPQPQKVLLYFHGNAGEALQRTWLERLDPQRKMTIVLAEYPGFGGRDGIATEDAIFESSTEIYDEIKARFDLPVTVFGESLGTGVACYLASKRPVDSVALAAPFTSAVDVASKAFWYFPVRPIMRDKFNSMYYLSDVTVPLRIIHGSNDNLIPPSHGHKLLDSYKGVDKAIYEIPGFGHNDLYQAIVTSVEAEEFRAFLRK